MSKVNHRALVEAGQGMLLPPDEVHGVTKLPLPVRETEEQTYYKPVLGPEEAEALLRLEFTAKALKNLAAESKAGGSQLNAANRLKGVEDYEEKELALVRRREKSEKSAAKLKLAAKMNFAWSIGIEPVTGESRDPVTDEVILTKVVAKDPLYNQILDEEYRLFRARYSGGRVAKARNLRLKEVKKQMVDIILGPEEVAEVSGFTKPQHYPTVYGKRGTYVNLNERAEYLLEAISAISQRTKRLGFDTASNTPEHSQPIFERYEDATSNVQAGAARNAEKYLKEAKIAFQKATGFQALRAIRYAPRHELNARARQAWEDFDDKLGGRKSGKERDEYRKVMARAIRQAEKIAERKAA